MNRDPAGRGFTCKNVWERNAPILFIGHDTNGDWQFLCGGNEHASAEKAVLIHPKHMFELYPDLREFANLAPGESATRAGVGSVWVKHRSA